MNQTGRSMIAIAVTRVLRRYEERGLLRVGSGRRWPGLPEYSAAEIPPWEPGMADDGGLGPIPQGTIDAIAEEIAQGIEQQLDAAQGAPQRLQGRPARRARPDWLSIVGGSDEPEEGADGDVRSTQGVLGDEGAGPGGAGREGDRVAANEGEGPGSGGQGDPPVE